MATPSKFNTNKYLWFEIGFMLFLTIGVTIISDLEYNINEEKDFSKFIKGQGYRLVTEPFGVLSCSVYYWGFLKRYVFKRHVWGIILCSAGYVVFNGLLIKYPMNWCIIHSPFIEAYYRKRALVELNNASIPFSFNYQFIAAIFPLTGLAFLIRSLMQEKQMKEMKEQQLLTELNYLKAQIHPHFFFNTINNIYSLALKQSADTAPMVAKLGEMMRYILYEADQKQVPISREITFLSNYIEVERIRHKNNIKIAFDVQGIQPGYQVAPLLLLPFIENAFKHGLEEETVTGYVDIIICQTEDELMLNVQNSKPAGKQASSAGIGLQNVLKRLDILYPNKYQLDIKDEIDHYQATLTLQTA
ncbi:sensor histidine kinase [Mucilaginibacter terrae]|uniref:Signal transduction histidine kinase internal region domain-containing protein n=1 Tax=Mucilaginibacter terrae TaxID=1955052 RepID=A0ABU3GVB1_9SPHI|nr:histidine kinase [Mucilaginibacter terrae]MDT3403704.1 hypothetical protein [Mucilaginibacter terrae]